MPIYEYRCSGCEARFERLQNVAGAVRPECPQCGSPHVARLISTIAGLGSSSSPGLRPSTGGGCGCGGACACGR